jgi:hypothetical protein
VKDIWVCSGCRSVNPMRSSRCYNCRTPRPAKGQELAAVDAPRRELSAAERADITSGDLARRHHTLPLALMTAVLIVATMVLHVRSVDWIVASLRVMSLGGPFPALEPTPDLPMLAWICACVVGTLSWGVWMGQVAHNVPLLGGGYPIVTPFLAIVESIVPVLNVYRCPPVMRDLTRRLSGDRRPSYWLIHAWMLASILFLIMLRPLSATLVYIAVQLLASSATQALAMGLVLRLVSSACFLASGVFALAILVRVERAQRRRATELIDASQPASASHLAERA